MGYISQNKALVHLERLDAWKNGQKPAPVTVEWDLSNRCYLGCQSCHFAHTHTKGPWVSKERILPMAWAGTGDMADTELVRRAMKEMAYCGVRGIIWSGGGEPTLHPDVLEIVREAKHLGVKQGMYTAGGLLDEAKASRLAQLLTWVVVSLDAETARTYADEKGVPEALFHKACNGVRWLAQEKDATVGVSFLLHGKNWNRVPEMLALGRELGGTYVTFRPTIDTHPDHPATITGGRSWIAQALPMLEEISGEADVECDPARFAEYQNWTGRSYKTCHGIKLNATITPDGRIWVCPQRRGIPGSCVGDLTTDSFSAIWQKHPGQWTEFGDCRAMCRLHLTNEVLENVFSEYKHPEFV